ncbi:hypothetical protein V6N13_051032 [Hibiscus sabdariffa]
MTIDDVVRVHRKDRSFPYTLWKMRRRLQSLAWGEGMQFNMGTGLQIEFGNDQDACNFSSNQSAAERVILLAEAWAIHAWRFGYLAMLPKPPSI